MDLFFTIFLFLFLIEPILQIIWFKPYFNNGILFYRRSVKLNNVNYNLSDIINRIFDRINNSKYSNKFSLISFNNNHIAFREKIFQIYFPLFSRKIYYTPIMRGLIIYNPDKCIVSIKGFVNYNIIIFFSIFIFFIIKIMINEIEFVAIILFVLTFLIIYIIFIMIIYNIQKKRYNNILNEIILNL